MAIQFGLPRPALSIARAVVSFWPGLSAWAAVASWMNLSFSSNGLSCAKDWISSRLKVVSGTVASFGSRGLWFERSFSG